MIIWMLWICDHHIMLPSMTAITTMKAYFRAGSNCGVGVGAGGATMQSVDAASRIYPVSQLQTVLLEEACEKGAHKEQVVEL